MINLLEGEKVVLVVRKHWFVIALEIFGAIFASVAPLILVLIFELTVVKNFLPGFDQRTFVDVASFFYFAWILLWWLGAFMMWTDYYLDEWIVTDQRVVTIEQSGLFHREIGSLRLDSIQNVSVEIPGLVATMFKMGNLLVETAGERTMFVMKNAEKAEDCKQTISHLCKEASDKMSHENLAGHIVNKLSEVGIADKKDNFDQSAGV
jgi:uncharacterized membrane protein YdbT with pleckstrin-like domain